MIKVDLDTNNATKVKRSANRKAKIDIILNSSYKANFYNNKNGKFNSFIYGIENVAFEIYERFDQRKKFIQAFYDNSQYKISYSRRLVKDAINFVKDPNNIELICSLKKS